ncbi:MAG: 3'-5' exonuclease [Syntrophales bacterium]
MDGSLHGLVQRRDDTARPCAGGEEEERRLFYVAATRAKDHLYFCYPLIDYARGMGNLPVSPSRFIMELAPYNARGKDRPYDQWLIDGE